MSEQKLGSEIEFDDQEEVLDYFKTFDHSQQTYVHLTEAKALNLFREYNEQYDGPTSQNYLEDYYSTDSFSYVRAITAMNSFENFLQDLGYDPALHIIKIVRAILNHSQIVIKAPRGHAKSKTLQLFTIWIMLFPQNIKFAWTKDPKPGLEILQISYSDDQSKEWQGEMQNDLERAMQIYKLPITISEKNKGATVLSNGSECFSKGMTGSLRGYHPHLILCDDLLTDRKYINDILLANIFYQTILGMALPMSKIVVVGTPLRFNDLLADLSELPNDPDDYEFTEEGYVISEKGFVYLKFKARYPDGTLLWGEFRDDEYLRKKEKTMGTIRFAREYLCEPMTEEGALFDVDALRRCERSEYAYGQVGSGDLYVGVDLAISTSPGSSNTAFCLWEEVSDGVLVLRVWEEFKEKLNKPKVKLLYEWDCIYGPLTRIEVEKNQYQESMKELIEDDSWRRELEEELRKEGLTNRPLRKLPVYISDTTWKKNEMINPSSDNISIRGLAVEFESQNLLFAVGDKKDKFSKTKAKLFVDELLSWIENPETGDPECLAGNDDKTMSMYVMWRGYKTEKDKGGGDFMFI